MASARCWAFEDEWLSSEGVATGLPSARAHASALSTDMAEGGKVNGGSSLGKTGGRAGGVPAWSKPTRKGAAKRLLRQVLARKDEVRTVLMMESFIKGVLGQVDGSVLFEVAN